MADDPSPPPPGRTFWQLHCPTCGRVIAEIGADMQGSARSQCPRCKATRVVVLRDGRLVIELELLPVAEAAERI